MSKNSNNHFLATPENSKSVTSFDKKKAKLLAHVANGTSLSRLFLGFAVGWMSASRGSNVGFLPVELHALSAFGDAADGFVKRRAIGIDPEIKDRPMLDDQMDKAYYYPAIGGIIFKKALSGEGLEGAAIATLAGASLVRDVIVTKKRRKVLKSNSLAAEQPKPKVNAGKTGKNKTALNYFGIGIAVSPIGETLMGRSSALGTLAVASVLSVVSGFEYHRSFKTYLQELDEPPKLPDAANLNEPHHEERIFSDTFSSANSLPLES